MFFSFDKKIILEEYPIFNSEIDVIIDFFNLDLVKDYEFGQVIYALYPDSYERLFEFTFQGKLKKGNILPYSKSKPMIIHVPSKIKYNQDIDLKILKEGLFKLSENYKKLNIKNIGIQKTSKINEEIINNLIEDLDFPNIVYFEKNKV